MLEMFVHEIGEDRVACVRVSQAQQRRPYALLFVGTPCVRISATLRTAWRWLPVKKKHLLRMAREASWRRRGTRKFCFRWCFGCAL